LNQESQTWPTEIRLKKGNQQLAVTFNDGAAYELEAELLRVMSPSAEVQGHSPDQKKTVAGKRNVQIIQVLPVGNYAVRLVFDDLHDTGIFSWVFLRRLGDTQVKAWADYEAELEAKDLSRDP